MPETFSQFLDKWLKQSTSQGLNNPLVKMPVKRFRPLQPVEFNSVADGGALVVGTMSEPIGRNLFKNYQSRIRERGERCAFVCSGTVEMTLAGGLGQQTRTALFPICLKRASLQSSGEQIKMIVADDATWQFNPVLEAHLKGMSIPVSTGLADNPAQATSWVKAQLGNRASQVMTESYLGLFSSQQMVVQTRLTEPSLRQALARNPVVQSKLAGSKVQAIELGEITDEGIEELGLVLPSDDSQLRVVQLSDKGCCLQVEGPPGTGKSQTIANVISNALYHGRNVLLVCDKMAAIVQVEERLTNCGLKPALLNLHDEDLDKPKFLKQATDKFPSVRNSYEYPFNELKETRAALNERVRFGRAIAHPSLQVARREALGGLIQLRKELKNVPNIDVANWQALSKERLAKLLGCLGQWPDLAGVLTDSENVWNRVLVQSFDENFNAENELRAAVQKTLAQIESLDEVREWAASVGIEMTVDSDASVAAAAAVVETVLQRPICHPKLVGNSRVSLSEAARLKSIWKRREELVAARHPVPLTEIYPQDVVAEAKELLATEGATTWQELSYRVTHYSDCLSEIEESQAGYLHACDQIGLVYSPLFKVRRAQLQSVLSLGALGAVIPRGWWGPKATPVLSVAAWKAHVRACATQAKVAPLPLHFVALERVGKTHWAHVERKAEHGFNVVSYCLNYVSDRKCKYALRQVFPAIPPRRFKQWQEVTLHAVAARQTAISLRSASETHVILERLTAEYLALAHENANHIDVYLNHADVQKLEKAAALVEQIRGRNDLFEIGNVHWQTFWEAPNQRQLLRIESLLSSFDVLAFPEETDNVEKAIESHSVSKDRIQKFLDTYKIPGGELTNGVIDAFAAQEEFAFCEGQLTPLTNYLELQDAGQSGPKWEWLHDVIAWRDTFERLCGHQKLDIDSPLWKKLSVRLGSHKVAMEDAYEKLGSFFEDFKSELTNYDELLVCLAEVLKELPRHPLWLEKERWQRKIPAYPEIKSIWNKILEGSVKPEQSQRLFCFNLLRLCDPIAKPHGLEFKQTLKSFREQDENLALWIMHHLNANLKKSMDEAAMSFAHSEGELRRLSSLQRVRGTVRELLNVHVDYLLAAKTCWMMSPTSLANLVDSAIFGKDGAPFDLVIFDEASQIRVLDGLLSMSFGKQVIIVGDNKQLPPTDFFWTFSDPAAEAGGGDPGISDSLLDNFLDVFEDDRTHVMLMSHYRSETPDLIQFSNDWFYDRKLEVYPPAHITGIGRRLHYVPNAIYSETEGQRNNPVEAKEVVKLIERHVRECPTKSLGVVTMNIPQMELIDEQLQFLVSNEVRSFCADEAKFFLRNLETVQGDEMDRIILSLTYGKSPAGHFSAAVLGPLTKSGGERRLNVAITRSRSGLIIVSSLTAADLETSGAQSKGFQCLKALILDLENSVQARTFGIRSKRFERKNDGVSNVVYCDSPFEEQVVEFLENEGYETECQYGAGRFWIDIVVKERGKNMLAIECDGAGYHSSLVARTRDRARQRILEKLGWRFHRVWSTNWWFFEQQEKDAIIEAINAARTAKGASA